MCGKSYYRIHRERMIRKRVLRARRARIPAMEEGRYSKSSPFNDELMGSPRRVLKGVRRLPFLEGRRGNTIYS